MHSPRGLTWPLKKHTQFELFTLMEEAPPVPPKDPAYSARMELDRPSTAPSSGSKRKRSTQDETYHIDHSELENVDPDEHTPKRNRNRSTVPDDDASASEDATAGKHRSIRKKKGSMNLSTLSLRHAAAKQAQIRESKFQEGSLNDKPSEKPPSVFLRVPRSESDHSLKVDEMMEDYHGDVSVPRYSTVKQQRPNSRAMVHMETYKKEDGKGLFQFGRQIAASFNPATLWQRWWSEPKEEATHATGEAQEKARQKAEVEARYAEMKKNGQFGFQTVRRRPSTAASGSEDLQTPRDSGIEIESLQNTRGTLGATSLMPPADDTTSHSGSEIPDTATKQNKTLKSRLHFKKPSLSNINDSLKRVKSDLNLGAAVARQRESSSSVSPIKQDFENSALKRSQSRYDLKKTNKLSKRVSDLESKLELAKRELDEALVDASPVPNLASKYPTFKPAATTFRRPKFVPGKLPSLPSERILMAEQMRGIRGDRESEGEVEPRKGMDVNERDIEMKEAEETIKASRAARSYPPRASTLFNLDNDNNNNLEATTSDNTLTKAKELIAQAELLTGTSKNMDPNSFANGTADNAPKQVETEGYSSLDAKLKALEENVKIANKAKQTKPKKRKSNADDDKLFKPGKESDGDSDWEESATPKKKRKSGGGKNETSPKNLRANKVTKQSPPKAKKGTGATAKANSLGVAARASAAVQQTLAQDQAMDDAETPAGDDEFSPDEGAASESEAVRTSIDSQDRTLGVVYEEEEDMASGAVSKPVAAATFGRSSLRSRSNSPHKRSASVQPGVEEQIITRAAIAAKAHPGRMKSRSISPPPGNGFVKTTTVEETVSVKPGANGVPKLPKGANGSFESLEDFGVQPDEVEVLGRKGKKASFEWPDDVF